MSFKLMTTAHDPSEDTTTFTYEHGNKVFYVESSLGASEPTDMMLYRMLNGTEYPSYHLVNLKADESLAGIARANAANQERLKKERADANKSVLRSYRIKH